MKFKDWFNENLGEYKRDIANYGCDAGYPHITYNSDGAELFDQFESEIMEYLRNQTLEFSYKNIMEFVHSFKRKDMALEWFEYNNLDDSTKTLLVWFMCESIAHGYL